jgi:hypothetical protein
MQLLQKVLEMEDWHLTCRETTWVREKLSRGTMVPVSITQFKICFSQLYGGVSDYLMNTGNAPSRSPAQPAVSSARDYQGFDVPAGVAALVLLNCALFAAAAVFKLSAVSSLAINPSAVSWYGLNS